MDWFEEYAAALEARLGGSDPNVHLTQEAKNPILDLAKIVAHGTERKNAPLAAYVTGRYIAARVIQGADEAAALAEAIAAVEGITPAEQ